MNEKRMKFFSVAALGFAALALVLVAYSFERGVLVMMHYVCPLVCAFAGIALVGGRYRKQPDLWMGAAFVGWYVVSRMLLGERYLDHSFMMFSNLCCAYLLALPFARCTGDGLRKHGLKTVSVIFVTAYGVLAWAGVFSALLCTPFTLPGLGTGISIRADRRLWAGNHPNISACMFLLAIMLGVWLIAVSRRRWLAVPAVLLAAGAYAGIALADSRTVMLQAGCFAAGAVFLGMLRLPVRALWKRMVIGLVAGAACLALVFVSFGWAAQLIADASANMSALAETVQKTKVAARSIWKDLATMTGRTNIYTKLLKAVAERPSILGAGLLNSEIVQVIRKASGAEHAHNAYLQTLLNMGLPGLLMAAYFTVRAVWTACRLVFSRSAAFADQLLAVMLMVLLVSAVSEPYLFTEYLTIANMPFFLIFGYTLEAQRHEHQ